MLLILLLLSVLFIVVSTTRWSLHPFLALLTAALGFGVLAGMDLAVLVSSINEGFGATLGNIGLVIIIGVIIGTFLEQSGGAYAIADKVLKITGEKRAPIGMTIIGYIVSIPVFADSGFVILDSLNKAISKHIKISLSVTAIALSIGLLASHAMVPPTPGPIAAAGILNADLGLVILFGVAASVLALVPTFLIITKIAANIVIDPNPNVSEQEIVQKLEQAPNITLSLLPILLPIGLIVIKSFNASLAWLEDGLVYELINFFGTPVIALLLGLLAALMLPKKLEKAMLSPEGWVGKALHDAAIIIMITGAGGAFGKVLQNSGLAAFIGDSLGDLNLGLLLPFLIAAAIKSAQGSSTVALITTASIMAPLMGQMGLTSDIAVALTVLIIGAGSLVTSHANDSFFWVFTQMCGMSVTTGYRLQSFGSAMLGCFAALIVALFWLVLA